MTGSRGYRSRHDSDRDAPERTPRRESRARNQAIMLGAANRVRLGLSVAIPGSAGFAWRLRYLDQAIPPSTGRPTATAALALTVRPTLTGRRTGASVLPRGTSVLGCMVLVASTASITAACGSTLLARSSTATRAASTTSGIPTTTIFDCGITTCATANPTSTAGSLSRRAILTRYAPTELGVTVEAKLVSLASLTPVDPDLTQCEVRGCAPGQLVWMILYEAPDNRFVAEHSTATAVSGATSTSPLEGPSFETFLVNADSGVGRGDSEAGAGHMPTYWSSLFDLASS